MARLTGPACRAARALLGWSMRDLREASGVALATITAIENGQDHRASTADKLVEAFRAHGVEITNGDGTGARLLLGMDRGEAARWLESFVDDLTWHRDVASDWLARLQAVEVRLGADMLPGRVSTSVRDLTDERADTYREAAVILRRYMGRE